MRTCLLLLQTILLAGCISFSSTETGPAPDYVAFCQGKESQCKEICTATGIQVFSCKAAPREGLEYQCQCNKPRRPL
jgi:hypothetical protein